MPVQMPEFTPQEMEAITESLKLFTSKGKDNMILFYQLLFEMHPEYHAMFPRLSECPVKDLGSNNWMRHIQGPKNVSLMYELAHRIEDPEAMRQSMRKLVHAPHHTRLNLRTHDYGNAFRAYIEAMKVALELQFQERHEMAWMKFFDYLLELIAEEQSLMMQNTLDASMKP